MSDCPDCFGHGAVVRQHFSSGGGYAYGVVCPDCGGTGRVNPLQLACGWAFDAGMREAERDRAQRCFVIQLREHKNDERAAVAAERERCARETRTVQEDASRAMRLAGRVTLDTQSVEEAMVAVLKLLEEARRLAYGLAVYGSPLCPASSSHDREWIAKEWHARRDAAILYGAPAPREG